MVGTEALKIVMEMAEQRSGHRADERREALAVVKFIVEEAEEGQRLDLTADFDLPVKW